MKREKLQIHLRFLFFFIFCLVNTNINYSQYSNLKFENYDLTENISSSTCLEIFQDSEGFMWFGTIDGLNRYDGYNFEVYRPILNDPTSLSNNRINSILEDNNGYLWIGTSNGLNVFDKKRQSFYRVALHDQKSKLVDQSEVVNDLLFDSKTKELWVATKKGVVKINLKKGTKHYIKEGFELYNYTTENENPNTIDNNDVTSIVKDKEDKIWVVTEGNNLNLYNSIENNFSRKTIDVSNNYELNHIPKVVMVDSDGDFWLGNNLSNLIFWDRNKKEFKQIMPVKVDIPIFHLYQDSRGIIWITTDGDGIYLLDKKKGLIKHIVHSPTNQYSLPNNQPSKVLEDKEGVFWIATYNKGISKLVLSKSSFGHYFYASDNKKGLSGKIAQSVLQDSKGRIWIGTDGSGLNLFNEKNKTFTHFKHIPNNNQTLSSDKIVYLSESFDNSLWVSTWDGGLNKFNPSTGKVQQYKYNPKNPFSIGQNTVWCTVEDAKKRLWLGTQSEGLNLFDSKTGNFYKYKNIKGKENSLVSNLVFFNFIDSKNRLLLGTSLGLSIVELDKLDNYIPKEIDFIELSEPLIQGTRVNYITEDSLGNIWLGTDIALHHLDENLKLIKSYSILDGLPNNLILGIKEDYNNNLWITTKGGLAKLDLQNNKFYNYNEQDGVQGLEFQSKSIEKLNDGKILVGGINGFNLFDPNKITVKEQILKPKITKFQLFNEEVKAGQKVNERVIINSSISHTELLNLDYDEGYLSFEFVAFHYQNQKRVQYKYRMLGLHEDFISSNKNRQANYSSIPPGKYTFEVKASLNGDWDRAEVTKININVQSPPWKTWWAYILYTLILGIIIWMALYYYTKLLKEDQERELDQLKLKFFVNVSHELRTPLTLILNPVDKILASFDNPEIVKKSALTLQRSSRRLLYLVNQLLDFRKMDVGKTPLKLRKSDYVSFCKDVFKLFKELAKSKELNFKFHSTEEEIIALFDFDYVEKVITNLLSNAIKFTEPKGSIKFYISKTKLKNNDKYKLLYKKYGEADFIKIKIKDTGIGFTTEQLKNVFGRFVSPGNTKIGMGIGLNITKGLVNLHDGEIFVKSKHKKGTIFTVLLPLYPKKSVSRITTESTENSYDLNIIKSVEYEIAITNDDNEQDTREPFFKDKEAKKTEILIVEDNNELRKHLKNELQGSYKIIEAINGKDGVEKVKKHFPELIISDVMMPEMDGFEFCKQIKTEIETCHIPIILLTAKGLDDDKIEGFKTGADAYLPKPYSNKVLRARIINLLETKRRLRNKFSSLAGIIPSSEITTNTLDEAFLDKATKVILDNISDPDFKLENLLTEIGVGRSQFYRKINSLTNQNPSYFIRTIRLKHAADLLLTNKYSIKEISHMSGFNSTAYFSKTFKELFKLTPTAFLEEKTKSYKK